VPTAFGVTHPRTWVTGVEVLRVIGSVCFRVMGRG